MDCLYNIQYKENCFFQERLVDRGHPDKVRYQQDVTRKSDPLLIEFMNRFSAADFKSRSFPTVFSEMLQHFKNNSLVQSVWKKGELNASFVHQWLSSEAWKEGLPAKNATQSFFLGCILETALYPIIITERQLTTKHLKIAQMIMTTDWDRQHLEVNDASEDTLASYWKYLEQSITEYGMLWHFVHHQVNTPYDHYYGLFPEKKVRFFCSHFLKLAFDTRKRNPFDESAKHFGRDHECRNGKDRWLLYYLPNGIPDPEGFCNKLDESYLRFAAYGDSFQAGSLLEFLCLSLLHFAIYNVPVRQCSLCKRYYIPVKNQSAEENFCHRTFKPGGHQSCSSYHSHCNSSPRTKGRRTPAEDLENKIKSLRSMLSRSSVMSYPAGFYWVDFLKNCVTFIKRSVKKGQLSIENAQMLIGKLKMIHHTISKQNHCPDIPVPDLYNIPQPDFEAIEKMLQDVLSALEKP